MSICPHLLFKNEVFTFHVYHWEYKFSECPALTYGVGCERTCTCDQNKTLSCDQDTGECLCKDGWAGVRCTCRDKSDCDENSYCDGTSCLCVDGFLTKPSNCSGTCIPLLIFVDALKQCV